MTEIGLPPFDANQFPADALRVNGITDVEELTPPEGLIKLSALLVVNSQCREVFEQQVGMPVAEWYQKAIDFYGLSFE